MLGKMVAAVPQPLAEEILKQYADVLRVGRVKVNGSEVCWATSGSTPSQLEAFSAAFCGALRKLPELQDLEDTVLCQAVYWFCKVVSINYVLCEVLQVVKKKVGKECSINTAGRGGHWLDYCVQVQPNQTMQVHLSWKGKGNIVHYDPELGRKSVQGTISSLVTEFAMPPSPCFSPTYTLHMKSKQSYKQRMISKLARLSKKQDRQSGICVSVDAPLHYSSAVNFDVISSCSTDHVTDALSSLTSEVSMDSIFSWDDFWEPPCQPNL